ncbi:hypothetical protein H6CHR_03649 [Variovorax sp. PBL-H6]|uniref:hypothetical protein n=1 Tax=Variovorax sp. PBL-H6 TaxID=434009 RepID=UPI0013173837|nr:hypothetical protein [Variovorax sp. PBL-H6]VTU31682.1 hypothetical protein H6CHR_03649 [Variovorax sp. PBL-H6]
MQWPMLSVLVSIGSLLVACLAAYIAWSNAQKQIATSLLLTEKQAGLAERLNNRDADSDRKRFVVDLWDKMTEVTQILPDEKGEYNEHDIWNALNNLELVATCWQNEIVDKRMVGLAFGENYQLRVSEINSIDQHLPKLHRTGPQLLADRRIILVVCDALKERANAPYQPAGGMT